MGFRFRRSFKIIPGVRVNLTHRGIGMSVGGRRGRISVNSRGRTTTTFSVPETGLSYTHSRQIGGKRRKTRGRNNSSNQQTRQEQNIRQTTQVDYSSLGIFCKNIIALLAILVGIIFLFISWVIGIVLIVIGVVLWNVGNGYTQGTHPIQRQEGLEEEIQRNLFNNQEETTINNNTLLDADFDRRNYDFIRLNFPEVAPKSFAGYMRMKNGRTENFMKLVELAEEKGVHII